VTREELREWCLSMPGAVEEFPFGDNMAVFKTGGKMFALSPIETDRPKVSVKCEPDLAAQLRESYEAIGFAYHLNKRHWISVELAGDVPDRMIRDLVEDSCDLVRPRRRGA
jgi:predicted DNA-binding protein (MmcQ/YjbR family)